MQATGIKLNGKKAVDYKNWMENIYILEKQLIGNENNYNNNYNLNFIRSK